MTTDGETYDLTPIVLENIERLGLDYLVPIGGDDTLSFSQTLADNGVPLVAIPKTMDNDVQGTEYCIGFSTAITRAKELINRQRTTLGSHERIGVFRIFGRDCGFTALYTAYVTTGRCLIPESPFDLDHLVAVLAEDHRLNPSHYSFVIAAEGAMWAGGTLEEVGEPDGFGHRHKANIAETLAAEIKRRSGIETVFSELTYDLRSGEPDAVDTMVAITFANVAMDLIADGVQRPHDRHPRRQVRPLAAARPGARRPARGRRRDVQRRALPAALHRAAGSPAAAGSVAGRRARRADPPVARSRR